MSKDSPDWVTELTSDAFRLGSGLRMFAVTRAAAYFDVAGLPAKIAANPVPIRDTARQAIDHLNASSTRLILRTDEGEAQAAEIGRALARDFFESVASIYSARVADEVAGWLTRHELDVAERNRFAAWSLILLAVASRSTRLDKGLPSLDSSVWRALRRQARQAWGPIAESRLDAARRSARDIELSDVDRQIVALEVSQPRDSAAVDIDEWMELAAREEAAFRAVAALGSRLSPTEWRSLTDWARRALPLVGGVYASVQIVPQS